LAAHCTANNDDCDVVAATKVLPEAPAELVTELSRRYILLYEKITGQQFQVPQLGSDPNERMAHNIQKALKAL